MKRNLPCNRVVSLVVLLGLCSTASAVMFHDTGDPAHNREVAPTGAYAGSGWQFQGHFGSKLATMISPNHIITARHVGAASTFVHKSYFNGSSTDVTYGIDNTVNGGLGYWNVGSTDLRIYQVTGTFSNYAPLYSGSDEAGKELVVMGRGTQRGATVDLGGTAKGWKWGAADHRARWGRNVVTNIHTDGTLGDLIAADFDAISGIDEAHLSVGDSGGAVFIKDGGIWKLAGINYAVDGRWDINDITGDGTDFQAALTDAGGFYVGSDAGGWTLIPDQAEDIPSQFYASRISSNLAAIEAITGVPEPSTAVLLLFFLVPVFLRRKR